QHVDCMREFEQRGEIVVDDSGNGSPAVVGNGKSTCFDSTGNAATDPAHTVNAHLAVSQRESTEWVLRCFPPALADKGMRLGYLPHDADKEPQSEIGDLLIQDIGGCWLRRCSCCAHRQRQRRRIPRRSWQ